MATKKTEKSQVLDFMKRTAEAIALTFGSSCETLIHDMSKPGHPIIVIFNGHVSGRTVGSKESIIGSEEDESQGEKKEYRLKEDVYNSLAVTPHNRYIKSTTIHYIGDDFHYALGINFDTTSVNTALGLLQELTTVSADLIDQISDNKSSQLEEIFSECVHQIGKPVAAMKKNDRLQLIALLESRNAFNFQKSVQYVAEQLGVSRYTVYKYCHEIESNVTL